MVPAAKPHLLHPALDPILLGGASLIFTGLLWATGINTSWIEAHFGFLLIFFSYPHFLSSYFVFYGSRGPWRRHPIVAIYLPLLLAGLLGAGMFVASDILVITIAQLTLVLVYWHFLKQAYGVSLWLGGKAGGGLSRAQKDLLLLGLLLFGCYGYLGLESGTESMRQFNLELRPLQMASWVLPLARVAAYGGLGLFVGWMGWSAARGRGATLGWQGWIPILALISWFEPALGGSPARLALPVFHGLQYLPFPLRVQRNEQIAGDSSLARWARRAAIWSLVLLVGWMAFEWLPGRLSIRLQNPAATRAFAAFALFFNLHHYFIDAVIWRFSDPAVLRRLVGQRTGIS